MSRRGWAHPAFRRRDTWGPLPKIEVVSLRTWVGPRPHMSPEQGGAAEPPQAEYDKQNEEHDFERGDHVALPFSEEMHATRTLAEVDTPAKRPLMAPLCVKTPAVERV